MKAIKDCKWEVTFWGGEDGCYWYAETKDDSNLEDNLESNKQFETHRKAINNFKKFAKLNGITNYKIKE